MRVLYVLAAIAMAAAVWFGLAASDAHDAAAAAQAANDVLRGQQRAAEAEAKSLEELRPFPLRYSSDALSEFVTRAIEAGETLGAGVRVEPRDANSGQKAMAFTTVRPGVEACHLTIQAGMEGDEAPAVLAMFEEELADLPIVVKRVKIREIAHDVAVTMDVDVPGRPK